MKSRKPLSLIAVAVLLAFPTLSEAQEMTLSEVLSEARTRSVLALKAKSTFVSDYWAWRSYLASRLPSLSIYGELGNFNRYLNLLQNPETGEMVYVTSYNLQNTIGLGLSQNITATGGTLKLYSDLNRIDEFGDRSGKLWAAQPITLSYSQPLFGYNQFKWAKRISPKEYERAKRRYLESMEEVTLTAAGYYYGVMLAAKVYDASVTNYENTTRMLAAAKERIALGTVTRDQYLQLELRQLNDSVSINENMVSLKKARMQLNSLLGYDETVEVVPVLDEELPDLVMDYDLVYRKCNENSSFVLDNDIDILTAESDIARAKADRGIAVQLDARFGLTGSDPVLSKTYSGMLDQEVVGLSFSVPVFDWGLGKGKVKKAEAAAEVVRAQVAQAENDKRISLFTAVGQFNNQQQQCNVSRRAAAIAEERYGLVMEKFMAGTASVTDLNTARSENDDAMSKYINDLSSYWNYYYTLRKLTLYDFIAGRDLDVDFEEMVK
ncbi:MAG: TolC family protein [Bacteroidales bacterium]|nr:TolC family protein [Bacteroidales bacterium]